VSQELAQRDMSVVKKNQLRERFTKIQNAFAADAKAQQAAKVKQVSLAEPIGTGNLRSFDSDALPLGCRRYRQVLRREP
jgi:hypothetical protein